VIGLLPAGVLNTPVPRSEEAIFDHIERSALMLHIRVIEECRCWRHDLWRWGLR
jgi:hypothetical protein